MNICICCTISTAKKSEVQIGKMVQAKSDETSVLMLCDKEILYHGFLCFTAITVIVTQATILNFYIIAFFRGNDHHVSKITFQKKPKYEN